MFVEAVYRISKRGAATMSARLSSSAPRRSPRIGAQHVGQRAAARRRARTQTPRTAAPVDLTGYWVAVVTEDWRHRMATARKGDFESLPLNAEGVASPTTWDLEGR